MTNEFQRTQHAPIIPNPSFAPLQDQDVPRTQGQSEGVRSITDLSERKYIYASLICLQWIQVIKLNDNF